MESLPPELVGSLYHYLSPKSYRRFQQTGRKYKAIGEDPYFLKETLVTGENNNWIIKTNSRGDCLNSLYYSELRSLESDDSYDNNFVYEYRLDNPNLTATAICPMRNGYLEGLLTINSFDQEDELLDTYEIPMVKGKAHGKAKFIDLTFERQINFTFNHGVIVEPHYRGNLEPRYDPELGYLDASYTFENEEMKIFYINSIGITDLINRDDAKHYMLSQDHTKYLVWDIDESTVINDISSNFVIDYLPKSLTNKDIPIFRDSISEIILPLSLFNCSSYEKIKENVNFLINRYRFYIDGIRPSIER